MPDTVINPRDGRYALSGRIVTMNDHFDVLNSGVIYIQNGAIEAVQPGDQPAPEGFETSPVIQTEGTIYPGLIEIHNHISYNILPLWNVPKTYKNREEWRASDEKDRLITAPMYVLGHTPTYTEAIIRYVECKCLLAGVTTSQGIPIYGVGARNYYRGLVRNVEDPIDPLLPAAISEVNDVHVWDRAAFWEKLKNWQGCYLLHLCEGTLDEDLEHFNVLKLSENEWAINSALAGIHSTALQKEQFETLARYGGSVVWSPLSNLILYGKTTKIKDAFEAGLTISLGSDWSPSGSKNLLGELKVAQIVANLNQIPLQAQDIVAMATRNPAKVLKWQNYLGSIEANKQADLLIINNQTDDSYQALINATENEIHLVVINGIPRYGTEPLMHKFEGETESVQVGGSQRLLNLWDEAADPIVNGLTLAAATERLHEGLSQLSSLAKKLEDPNNITALIGANNQSFDSMAEAIDTLKLSPDKINQVVMDNQIDENRSPVFLDLDEGYFDGLPAAAPSAVLGAAPIRQSKVPHYSDVLSTTTITLDPLTIVDDPNYFPTLLKQLNLPDAVKLELPKFYGYKPILLQDVRFLAGHPLLVQAQFADAMDLPDFLNKQGYLTIDQRILLVQQALLILERVYVHLPMKRSMYAIDPVQRLRLMLFDLEDQAQTQTQDKDYVRPSEIDFHREMLEIFTSLRDLHTNYIMPSPYRGIVAFLPFLIEEYFDEQKKPHYIISKVVGDFGSSTFKTNVEILYWNGMPIQRAIELNSERHAGGNQDARHARGLDSLTIRPLTYGLPPDEDWVTIQYRTDDNQIFELTQKWLVYSASQQQALFGSNNGATAITALGVDGFTDAIQQVKKTLYAAEAIEAAKVSASTGEPQTINPSPDTVDTLMPTVFRAKVVDENCGYIRIFTFNVDNAESFVDEFVRLAEKLPKKGLILDVRGNGGGLIYAAERLFQVLTDKRPIEPSRAQFINSSLILQLCRLNSPSTHLRDFSLELWTDSVRQAVRTGATYSQAIPITNEDTCNSRERAYPGPVILIVDAMCYSATDIFAAGFIDHEIGDVIGISDNTGAGGANVWNYSLLQSLMTDPAAPQESSFKTLPYGADMRVAIRRTLRVRKQSGTPLEDLGIRPTHRYRMTKNDLLNSNASLIEYACQLLTKTQS